MQRQSKGGRMNKVILIGNLTKDVELSQTPNNIAVAKFTVAVQKIVGEGADFINCVAWRKLGENLEKYCKKGDKIAVVGKLETRTYEAQDGSKRYITEVICDDIEYLNTKKAETSEQPKQQPELKPIDDFDPDLPF